MTPSRRHLLALAAAALAAPSAAQAAPAPAFTAKTAKGKSVSLAQYRGKTVIMEWTNSGCPYVGKHYGSGGMQALQKEMRAEGAVWLSVISSAPGEQGYLTAPQARDWARAHGAFPSEILLDPTGELGRLYGAKTTPDMRVIDAKGELVYQGAIDDKPSTKPEDMKTAKNYVRMAMAAMKAGQPVSTPYAKPYGCSVKYAS